MAQLTTEQRNYIVAHINDRPRTAVARAAGVSLSAVYRIVHEQGGIMQYERTRRNPYHVELVRKYYPTMTGSEMQAKFGISKKLFERIARELKLKHTPETLQRIEGKKKANMDGLSREYKFWETWAEKVCTIQNGVLPQVGRQAAENKAAFSRDELQSL